MAGFIDATASAADRRRKVLQDMRQMQPALLADTEIFGHDRDSCKAKSLVTCLAEALRIID